MKKPTKVTNAKPQTTRAQRIWQQLIAGFILPALGIYALYLATDYLPLLKLRGWPDFASISLLKANFTGSALLFFSFAWRMGRVLHGKTVDGSYENRLLTAIAGFTLVLLIVINSAIFTLHFTVYSSPHYIRCWEPVPMGSWHYARTPEICVRHGYAPIRDTATPRSNG
ncbi:TPA: hypothetical protein ACV5EY_002566 [Klebsiella aerogenes]|uniref:hypothetical protein n=1 Tax=Klebsiella TaxID=570 RepID=UPI002287F095|nr:hypothetical protein [Klebsiella aerogenes]HCT4436979.1 hypothetical protein [Klebsiella aerogenes]